MNTFLTAICAVALLALMGCEPSVSPSTVDPALCPNLDWRIGTKVVYISEYTWTDTLRLDTHGITIHIDTIVDGQHVFGFKQPEVGDFLFFLRSRDGRLEVTGSPMSTWALITSCSLSVGDTLRCDTTKAATPDGTDRGYSIITTTRAGIRDTVVSVPAGVFRCQAMVEERWTTEAPPRLMSRSVTYHTGAIGDVYSERFNLDLDGDRGWFRASRTSLVEFVR